MLHPQLKQITVVRATRIARLAGRIGGDAVVPVLGIEDNAEGRAAPLIVARAGIVQRSIITAAVFPAAMASTTVLGPVTTSPPANKPLRLVVSVWGSLSIEPHLVA